MTDKELLTWAENQRLSYPRYSKGEQVPRAVIALSARLTAVQEQRTVDHDKAVYWYNRCLDAENLRDSVAAMLHVTETELAAVQAERDELQAKLTAQFDEAVAWEAQKSVSRGEVVPACPRCNEMMRIEPHDDHYRCLACGNHYTEPTYWQRVTAPDS